MSLPSKNWGLNLNYQKMQDLKGYYQKLLCDCKLQSLFDADDILSKVQEKANEANRLERLIKHPVPWAKKVGERIIFQQRRKEISKKKASQKIEYMVQSQIYGHSREDFHFDSMGGELLTSALNELQQIKPEFHELIVMRFFNELSWEDISSQRYPNTEITKTIINRVRKQGSRALEKLREIFFSKLEN